MKAILETEDLVKYYGEGENQVRAIDHTSMQVQHGEFVAVVGRSGSGKSTLLHMLGGLDRPDSGKVYIEGRDIFDLKDEQLAVFRRRKIGFIFQDYNLMPALNVWENIVLPIGLDGKKVKKDFVLDIVKSIGMEERLHAMPNQLSGGQKQRVAIAGVMAMQPECIVLDEPTAMLDPVGRKEVLEAVHALNREKGVTIILITHYMEEVVEADHVYVMDAGKVVMQGTPRSIFSQVERLKEYRLDVPQITLLAYELKKAGLDIPDGILTREELTEALEKLCQS